MGGKSSFGAGCDGRRVPGPEGQTSDDLDHIDTAWDLIKRAQRSLDDARNNATRRSGYMNRADDEYVPTLLESIVASLLAIAKRM